MNFFWFLRMRRWVQHPPSPRKVKVVLAVIALCLALYAIERWLGWPEALQVQPGGGRFRPMH